MKILSIERLFRWHLWMGCLISPLLFLMSITGCILVFRHEIQEYWQREVRCVLPGQAKLPISGQLESLRSAHPDWIPTTVTIANRSDRSTLVQVTKPIPIVGSIPFVGIDPYSGQVLGEAEANLELFDRVLTIHKTMLLGPDGRILVELVASWAIVTVLSGASLWLVDRRTSQPASGRGKQRVRSLLRSLHAGGGMLLSVPILAILLSGLFFTTIWSNWANYFTGGRLAFPNELLVNPNSGASRAQFSSPEVVSDSSQTNTGSVPDGLYDVALSNDEALLDSIIEVAADQFPGKALRVSMPLLPGESYRVHAMSDDGTRVFGLICFSPEDGRILHLAPENQWTLLQSARLSALSLHTGSLRGTLTKCIAMLASAMLLGLAVSGPCMLWLRVPGRLVPGTSLGDYPQERRHWLVTAVILFLTLLLPTVGFTVLIFLLIQWSFDRLRRS